MDVRLRFLIFIDFSTNSESIIRTAHSLSLVSGSELIFIHKIQLLVPAMVGAAGRSLIAEEQKNEAIGQLKSLVEPLIKYTRASFHASELGILEIIEQYENHESETWIFTGLKGTGPLKKIFMGSTTTKIVDHTHLISLAIPTQYSSSLPERLVIALHYKIPVNKDKLKHLISIFSSLVNRITFLSIVNSDDDILKATEYLDQMRSLIPGIPSDSVIFKGNEPLQNIQEFMLTKNNAYLVLQQGSRNFTDILLRRFLINELVYKALHPLIIIPK
ncbi:MAG TPA: universal stress protein [Saprospiraceae bacterium]|nr:universal stress protein [Saprospiraceae bacterium]